MESNQTRLYETFGGAAGHHVEIIVTPVLGENATLTGVVVEACAQKPPGDVFDSCINTPMQYEPRCEKTCL